MVTVYMITHLQRQEMSHFYNLSFFFFFFVCLSSTLYAFSTGNTKNTEIADGALFI